MYETRHLVIVAVAACPRPVYAYVLLHSGLVFRRALLQESLDCFPVRPRQGVRHTPIIVIWPVLYQSLYSERLCFQLPFNSGDVKLQG
jgi:hypothetical protein